MAKAQSEVLVITLLFEIMVVAIVMLMLFSLTETTNFSKMYIEKDFSILMNITKAVPGDVEIDYPIGRFVYKDGKFEAVGRMLISDGNSVTIKKEGDKVTIE